MADQSPTHLSASEDPPKSSYLPQVILATSIVALLPAVVIWSMRASGLLSSYLLVALLGVAMSLLGSTLGRAYWQRRPGSRNLLFSELMIWGYIHRRYTERRLNSARAVLGALSNAQNAMENGLSPERQAKLLEGFARALDARDPTTYGHSRRVARYSWMIATRMNLTREQVARIRTAAAIHDIGKIDTPDGVLNKRGPLTDEEYEVMKRHAANGALMAVALHDPDLTATVRHHHERLDGTGYPDGLAGEEIPIGSRIIAVADTFDALSANRPYRRAKTHQEALEVLKSEAGKQLDPAAVRAFCAHYSGRRGMTLWGWVTSLPARAFEQMSAVASGVGATAKTLAVAALAGSLASSSATLALPVHTKAAAPARVSTLSAPARATSQPSKGPTLRGGSKTVRAAAPATVVGSSSRPLTATTPAAAAAAGSPVPASASGAAAPALPQPGGEAGSAPSAETPAPPKSRPVTSKPVSGGSETPTAPKGSEKSGGGSESTVEKAKGKVEQVKGKVEEVKGKVEEVAKGKVEEVKAKVEEVKGKVEEVAKGKVEEVKGKVEEVKSKVEETKGKVEETTGKLKKITGLISPLRNGQP